MARRWHWVRPPPRRSWSRRGDWQSPASSVRCRPMDDYQRVLDTFAPCKRVLITTHVRPDGDALGSAAALAMGMTARGIAAEVLLLSYLPTKYAFIFQDNGIVFHDAENGWPAGLTLDSFDAF